MAKNNAKPSSNVFEKIIGWVMTICGAVGVYASFMLSIEEIKHLKNPGVALNCDINPLIGCGSILDTWQGHVFFGVPNQFFGLIGFAALTTLGVLILAGIKYPKWIWQGLQLGAIGGLLFVAWFIYQSMFVLNHLCPYCMVTWVVTLILFWYITVYNLSQKNFPIPKQLAKVSDFVQKHHVDILVGLFVFIILSILYRFRDFFFA